jgi:competence protein ComEA
MPERSRATVVVWALAAVLAVVAGARLLGGDDPAPAAPVRLSSGRGHDDARIYIHVVGAVQRPGLMRLPAGARVAEALRRAGGPGPRADLGAVNLAARLADGQQIVVPRAGAAAAPVGAAAAPGAGTGGAAGGGATGVHLSSATVEQLDGIDGIGPTLAQRIIEYRDAHGGLRSLAELAQVEGIGEKRLATLREALQP